MGIISALKTELFIDIIEWIENDNDTIAFRYDRKGNDIRNGAKLTVREGQTAVFVNEGQLADVFDPGMYTLETQNLPILSRLKGWQYGFKSPFKAEVYFISTRSLAGFMWGTPAPFSIRDPEFGVLSLRARGAFSFRVGDASAFIRAIVGTEGEFTKDEIRDRLRQRFVTQAQSGIAGCGKPFYQMAENLAAISAELKDRLAPAFYSEYGLMLEDASIQAIELTEESAKKIEGRDEAMFNDKRIDNYERMARADALKNLASNPGAGGLAAGAMGMGMGMAVAGQAGGMMGMGIPGAGMPPPLPQAAPWYISVNGQQVGPVAPAQLQAYAQQGQLTAATMAWRQGMAGWAAAGSIPELAALFGPPSAPPSPPPLN
jgi:membrane protease subunit (stomatin/prohibitin family)